MGLVTIPDAILTEESAADGQPLRDLVCNALRQMKAENEVTGEVAAAEQEGAEGGGGEGWADADWASVRAKLVAVRDTSGPNMVWSLALPKNHVVAVRLTADVLSACFSHFGATFNDQMVYYREETYKPGYCAFRVGDYAVRAHAQPCAGPALTRARAASFAQLSDIAQLTNMNLFSRTSNDRTWVWKPLNKVRAATGAGLNRRRRGSRRLRSIAGDARPNPHHAHHGRLDIRRHLRGRASPGASGRRHRGALGYGVSHCRAVWRGRAFCGAVHADGARAVGALAAAGARHWPAVSAPQLGLAREFFYRKPGTDPSPPTPHPDAAPPRCATWRSRSPRASRAPRAPRLAPRRASRWYDARRRWSARAAARSACAARAGRPARAAAWRRSGRPSPARIRCTTRLTNWWPRTTPPPEGAPSW